MKLALCNPVLWTSPEIFREKRHHSHSPPGLARQSGCLLPHSCLLCFPLAQRLLKALSAAGFSVSEQVCVFIDHFSLPACPLCSSCALSHQYSSPVSAPFPAPRTGNSARCSPQLLGFDNPSLLARGLSAQFAAGKTELFTT